MRDARRRRARHRGAARDGYQEELRGLISAQMETFIGKWNDEDADTKSDVRIDEPDEGRRSGHDSDRRDHVRKNGGSKYLYRANRIEHTESREDKQREYEREKRRTEYKRENKKDKKIEYENESKDAKRREYQRDSRVDQRREYENDKKYKEKNKLYKHGDRRPQRQYNKEYFEIKQEYPSVSKKKKERRYDYKDREQETDKYSSRVNKKYHNRDDRYHKQKSDERHRDRNRKM